MELALLGSLAVLALIDSTSFGTLLIPIWLLLHPGRVRVSRIMVFLGTVAVFYFGVGLALTLGLTKFMPQISRVLETPAASWTQLVLGVALFFLSFRMGKRKSGEGGSSRILRWRERALGAEEGGGGVLSLMGLALTAAILEVGTMLPYLAAIGLITTAELPMAQNGLVLAGYCLVMILPALLLTGLRLTVGHRIEPLLTRISNWMTSSETLAWIVGIVGFLLARDAIFRLNLMS